MEPSEREEFHLGQHVMITTREIYDVLVRLTGRVETLITQHEDTRNRLQDHEQRIRNLESNRWPIPAATVLIALAALVLAIFKQ
jgi:BMFP domain-containing protein YqiC